MLNLIKMDLHRMFHSPSTWIILAFSVALAVFNVIATNLDIQSIAENPQSAQLVQSEVTGNEDRTIGIVVETDPEWIHGPIEAGEVISTQLRSGILVLVCVIFTALFVNAEHRNGYIKNIAGQFPRRGMLVLSKLAAIALQVLLMLILFTAATALSGWICWGSRLYLDSFSSLLPFLGTQYLLHLGFSALILFLCVLTRSSAFSMVIGLLACCGALIPVYSLVNQAVYNIQPGWNFDISRYMLDGNISMAGIGAGGGVLLRAVLVSCAFLVIFTAAAMALMKKRDVR